MTMERARSREEMQREVAELWAASKQQQQPPPPQQPQQPQPPQQQQQQAAAATSDATSREPLLPAAAVLHAHAQAHVTQQQQQQQPADGEARIEGTAGLRQSSEKRKPSSDYRWSLEAAKGGGGGGGGVVDRASLDSGALWHTTQASSSKQLLPFSPDDEEGSSGSRCLRWLPFKAISITLRRHPSIWITSLLVFLALATGGILGVYFVSRNETEQRRLAAEGFAINAAVAFERQLQQMFFPLLSLAVIVRSNPSYKAVNATFDATSKELMEQMPTQGAVTNLIAAPQGVLRNFYPMTGYCQDKCNAININLFKEPERRPMALKTVKAGRLVMQGPMMLSQGYFGVVGRQPIFISNSTGNETFGAPDGLAHNCSVCYNATTHTQFWGFVNAIINLQSLVNGNDSRLRDLRAMGYTYEMYKIERNGTRTEIARSVRLPEDPVTTDVHVPGGLWYLQVSPEQGWVPVWRAPILAVVVCVCGLFGLLLGAILVSAKLQAWLKCANGELAREKERMDVLLARQHNLLSCLLQDAPGGSSKAANAQSRTLARIEDMRREIGVAQHTNGTTAGADELQLIELIDEGTYGKVFRGLWRGSLVAVKTMVLPAKMSGSEKRERMAVMEAAISSAMNHPNIVQTYTYIIKPCATTVACCNDSEAGEDSSLLAGDGGSVPNLEPEGSSVHNFEVSLVLELCDWGSLRTALDAGAFFAVDNSLNYPGILDTAADVARAMLHLHKNHVLHSDLKVRNVLLKSDASGRGCIAKVADFGLAVQIDCMATHVSAFQGTLSHLPPEALLHGRVSKAGDVYAYGITLWELFTGGTAYQGIPRALVGHKVAVLGLRPTLPPFTPPAFRSLVEDCWHQDPEKRPTFDTILARVVQMRADLNLPATPPLTKYKLQPKEPSEPRVSSEKAPDGAVLNAQHAGLLHLGSYYVNTSSMTSSSDFAGLGSGGGSSRGDCSRGDCSRGDCSRGDCSCGAGDLQHSRRSMDQQQQQLQPARRSMEQPPGCSCSGRGVCDACAVAGSNGSAGAGGSPVVVGPRAPRTAYLRSGLYTITGSPLCTIPDTEHLEDGDPQTGILGGHQAQPPPPPQQQQQQPQQQQQAKQHQPPQKQAQQQQPWLQQPKHPSSAASRSGTQNGGAPASVAAAADGWPPAPARVPGKQGVMAGQRPACADDLKAVGGGLNMANGVDIEQGRS